jgi:capsid protein
MALLDFAKRFTAPKIAAPVTAPALSSGKSGVQAGYMKNGQSPFFFNWHPFLRDEREDTRAGYMMAAARTVETIQNSGWLAGAVDQSIAAMIGTGLRLSAKPDFEALGMTKDEADKWARDIERRWEAWASNPVECDAAGVCNMAQMTSTVVRYYYSHGEAVALLPHVERSISRTRTKVKLIPPHKITQDSNGYSLFQGVWMDAWGLPVAYRMMLRIGQMFEQLVTVPARDAAGRPQVVHVFEGGAEQVRGITPLAPALHILRQYDQLADATLQGALIQALFAATITSDAPTQDVLNALQDEDEQLATQGVGPTGTYTDYLNAKSGWYQNTKIDLGRAGRIAHLFPAKSWNSTLRKARIPIMRRSPSFCCAKSRAALA